MHFGHRQKRLNIISKLGISYFFSSMGFALIGTIWAVYLDSFFNNASTVGLLSSFFTAAGIFSYLILIPLIERKSKSQLLFFSIILFAISYFIFSIYSNVYVVIILGIILAILSSLKVTTFGLLVRDKTKEKDVSKNEGIVYTLSNFAWIVGPLIAGYLLKVYGPKNIFFIGSLLVLTSFILMKMFRIKDNRKSKKIETNIFKIVKEFFSNKNRTLSYIISTSVTIWWALIFIYLPIHIVEGGYNELLVGIFLSAVIIPLILLEYKFGKIGGKKGFKKLFFSGFIILGLISIACFFVSNIYLLLGLLILASVGIAMIEPTSEAYFFDLIGENQRDKYYGVYNTGVDIGYFIGTLPASLILIFLPFKFIFPFFALFMIVLAIVSLKIKEVYEYKRK